MNWLWIILIVFCIILVINITSKMLRFVLLSLVLVFGLTMFATNGDLETATNKVKDTLGFYTGIAKKAYDFAKETGSRFHFSGGVFTVTDKEGNVILEGTEEGIKFKPVVSVDIYKWFDSNEIIVGETISEK